MINLTDVPEAKRKFWPQHSVIVIDRHGEILDVIQHFEPHGIDVAQTHSPLYPQAAMFFAWPDLFASPEELRARIKFFLSEPTASTYVIGKGGL